MYQKLRDVIIGKPRDLKDPHIFQHVSLMAFLAWVGLGADGLSSSAYGPDEAYRALGQHTHLAPLLVLMTAVTIVVISIAYSNLIEHFPGGGGGLARRPGPPRPPRPPIETAQASRIPAHHGQNKRGRRDRNPASRHHRGASPRSRDYVEPTTTVGLFPLPK